MADTAKTKPKKKPFMTIGVPGARRTLGGGKTGGGSPVFQPNLLGQMGTSRAPVKTLTTPTEGSVPVGSAPAGRPPTNLGKYLIKPTDSTITGYEMLNETPDLLDSVHTKFLQKFELPTHLRPTRFLSPELEHGRGIGISKGFRAPRSRSK
jgi:hypothetical protein